MEIANLECTQHKKFNYWIFREEKNVLKIFCIYICHILEEWQHNIKMATEYLLHLTVRSNHEKLMVTLFHSPVQNLWAGSK